MRFARHSPNFSFGFRTFFSTEGFCYLSYRSFFNTTLANISISNPINFPPFSDYIRFAIIYPTVFITHRLGAEITRVTTTIITSSLITYSVIGNSHTRNSVFNICCYSTICTSNFGGKSFRIGNHLVSFLSYVTAVLDRIV